MIDLIERLEKAATGSRALDVQIACAARYVPDLPGCDWAREPHWQILPVPRISERVGCADKAGNIAAHWEAPAYTTSLDAAMTLVPEGMESQVGRFADGSCTASIWISVHEERSPRTECATPALALCIAALLARIEAFGRDPQGLDGEATKAGLAPQPIDIVGNPTP